MPKVIIITLILVAAVTAFADEETHGLGRIVVTPSRFPTSLEKNARSIEILDKESFEISSWDALPDVIGNVSGVDIRRRGPENVQADINIRGTTFEQNTVLIDGINVNDPQTGHFDLDIPLTSLDIDKVEILKGPASATYGPDAFGGVINIITKKPGAPRVVAYSEGGSFDYYNGYLSVSSPFWLANNRISIQESRSSGYMPETNFNILSLTDTLTLDTPLGGCDFLFGYLKKDFGADSFYSNLYSNEEEHTDTRFFKLSGNIENGDLEIMPKLFLRRHWDKFMLDQNRPGWQTNYHTNYTYGGEIDVVFTNRFMDVAYGYELAQDTLDSTNMQTHSRTRDGIYCELSPHLADDLNINAGIRTDYFSFYGWEWSPSVSASYTGVKNLTLRGLAGRAFRIPTFTDLYYNDSANVGNPDLAPESSWTYEAGADYRLAALTASATFFHRNSYDTIDWTRMSTKNKWNASNIGTVDTNGFELYLECLPKKICGKLPVQRVFFSYTTIDSYNKHDYLSKYALDYLKQQIASGLDYELLGFRNSWVLNYKKRIGDSGYIVVDTKVSKNIVNKGRLVFDAFFEITNLFDIDYSEQSNIQMPGRWIRSGGRIQF